MNRILLKSEELSSVAARKLREMIIEKEMQPGDKLPTENELVAMFGVSRSTVREAVKILTAENVVEIKRGRGTYITMKPGLVKDPLGLEFTNQTKLLDNLLETRMMFEPQIAYLAAQRATPDNIDQLAKITEQFQSASDSTLSQKKYDIAFHTAVAECTQNDVLHRILPIINETIHHIYIITASDSGIYKRAIQCHTNIFQAIMDKDPNSAKNETEKHVKQSIDWLNHFRTTKADPSA